MKKMKITAFYHKLGYIANICFALNIIPIGYGKGYTKDEAIKKAYEFMNSKIKK